ncbi:hypothetical protein BDU57DRAFT_573867 [Ampelomyces quisqualis]|uniref:Uncharacterized protein n=1 Tax=Ampelomyces quisqualis TaxID=50730 RepID=A0A6A5QL39_AMPQU|nr:hypothetical protein BDU57DRAFT_573867 [Ampelomyces quisqualis]
MRLLPLVGLIGLADSVVASPTPSDSKASAAKRLVVYAEGNFQGPSYEIEATNRCVKLEAPVYKNLHSYGVVNQVCYFMDSEKCNSKTLITADGQDSAVWGRVDVGGIDGDARRIAAVYCSDKATKGTFEADTTNAEADLTLIESRADNVVASPPGYVQACKYDKSRSAMMACTTVDALNSCRAFNSNFAKNIDVITQGRKSDCTYWENSDCRGRYVVESFNQGDGDYNPNLGPGNKDGKLISAVSCKNFGLSKLVETRAIKAMASPPGNVRACRNDRNKSAVSCVYMQALNACKPYDEFFANHIDSILQGSRSICTYWKNKDCAQGIVEVHNAGNVDWYLDLGHDNMEMKDIRAVSCENIGSSEVLGASYIRTIYTDRSLSGKRQLSNVTSSDLSNTMQAGDVQVCSEPQHQGICDSFNAMRFCWRLAPQHLNHLKSYHQAGGATCTFWTGEELCKKALMSVQAPHGDVDYNTIFSTFSDHTTHISCEPSNTADEVVIPNIAVSSIDSRSRSSIRSSPQPEDNDNPSFHDADDKPGSVTVCPEYMFQFGSCQTYNVLNLCLALPQQLWRNVKSLVVAKGAHCEFYGDDHGCNDVRVRYDTVDHGVSDGYVYDDVGYTHVWCTTLNSAELDQSAGSSAPIGKRETNEPVPALDVQAPHEGQVLVADRNDLGGKTQLVDTTTDDNNCAPLFNQFFWNLHSLHQYKGSVCTYWQYNCGSLSEEDQEVFTIDSRQGDYILNSLPAELGENRHKIAYIQCINALLADEYMAQRDPADPTVFRVTSGSELVARLPDVNTSVLWLKPFRKPALEGSPLWVCHNPNLNGQCFAYIGDCAPNPFNVDAIESLWLAKGYRCAMYGTWDCQATKGPPHYVDSRDGEIIINDIEYEIWSIRCTPSPYHAEVKSKAFPDPKTATRSLAERSTDSAPQTLWTEPNKGVGSEFWVCHEPNLAGACFGYTGRCLANPFNVDPIKSYFQAAGYRCALYPHWNCEASIRGPPKIVDSSAGPVTVNNNEFDIWSVACLPAT